MNGHGALTAQTTLQQGEVAQYSWLKAPSVARKTRKNFNEKIFLYSMLISTAAILDFELRVPEILSSFGAEILAGAFFLFLFLFLFFSILKMKPAVNFRVIMKRSSSSSLYR